MYFQQIKNNKNIDLRDNINKLYLYHFFYSFMFIYVIERLFGLERGLSIQQMVYLEILFAFFTLILEIPTGKLSDKYGYKLSIIIGSLFGFADMIVFINAYSFQAFCLSIIFASICVSLLSGSMNSLLYESLKIGGDEDKFEAVLGKQNLYATTAAIIASLTGGYIGDKYGLSINYYLSAVSFFICIIISLSLTEPKTHLSIEESSENFKLKDIINFFNENTEVKILVFYNIIFGSLIVYIEEYYQIYLNEINVPVSLFGIILVFILSMEGLSRLSAYKIKEYINLKLLFSISITLSSMLLIMTSYFKNYYSIGFIIVIFFLYGITEPLILGKLHHNIKSDRATIESFMSFGLRGLSVIIGLIFGYVSTNYSIFSGFLLLGVIMLAYSILYILRLE